MSINLKKVPDTPGVYKFFNNSEIIYIGKAKNLKKTTAKYIVGCRNKRIIACIFLKILKFLSFF